jgi:hypothetical protein
MSISGCIRTTRLAVRQAVRPVRLAAAAIVLSSLWAAAPAAARPAALDASVELHPRFARILYVHPTSLLQRVAPSGANGTNAAWEAGTNPYLFIEEQRHGEEAVMAGIAMHAPGVAQAGLRELDWGFAHQHPDGGFAPDFHSVSFFVEGTAHLILVLRGLEAAGRPLPRGLLHHLELHLPALHRAARWMARPDVYGPGYGGDAPYTHRRYLVAGAFGLTGLLTADRRLAALGRRSARDGLAAQRSDGVNPELGGHDSSYQARGLAYAERYLAWLPAADPLRAELRAMVRRGLAWERGRILPSGRVSIAGNTRVGGTLDAFDHNGRKRVVYPMVARAFAWWGATTGSDADLRLASRVAAYGRSHPHAVG